MPLRSVRVGDIVHDEVWESGEVTAIRFGRSHWDDEDVVVVFSPRKDDIIEIPDPWESHDGFIQFESFIACNTTVWMADGMTWWVGEANPAAEYRRGVGEDDANWFCWVENSRPALPTR